MIICLSVVNPRKAISNTLNSRLTLRLAKLDKFKGFETIQPLAMERN
jgi:hypothetical protein